MKLKIGKKWNPIKQATGASIFGSDSILRGNVGNTLSTALGGETSEDRAKQAEKKRQAGIATSLAAGKQQGLDLAAKGYGQGLDETGQDIQRVKELQRARTEGSDPISAAIRGQKAGAVANTQRNLAASGVKGGAAAGAIDEISRRHDSDIAASLYGQQAQNIGAERSLASNTLAGTTSLMFGSEGAANADNMPKMPETSGVMGKVICTELYRQGYFDERTYLLDIAYGIHLRKHKPYVYIGYRAWADYVVKAMKKSNLITKLVSTLAVPWAENMAGKSNTLGAIISYIGEPICEVIGKLNSGVKYVRKVN